MNILIIRLSSIGDILLTTPFVRQVKSQIPEANLYYVIKNEYSELISQNPHISSVFEINTASGKHPLKALGEKLKREDFDYVFDLHNNLRSNYLRRVIPARTKSYIHKDKIRQTALVRLKINLYKTIRTIPERYLDVGAPAGIVDDRGGLEIFWNEETEANAIRFMCDKGINPEDKTIALAPGAGFYTKRWPPDYFAQLIDMINAQGRFNILILGGEHERLTGKYLGAKENVYDFTAGPSLLQTAVFLSKTAVLISNDSGVMHMATAVKTPVVAMFGSSVRELGFFPYRSKNTVLEMIDLKCRPCSHVGRNKCPRNHFKCMNEITPGMVFKAATKYL